MDRRLAALGFRGSGPAAGRPKCFGVAEHFVAEVHAAEIGTINVRVDEVRATEIGATEIGAAEIGAAEVRAFEVRTLAARANTVPSEILDEEEFQTSLAETLDRAEFDPELALGNLLAFSMVNRHERSKK